MKKLSDKELNSKIEHFLVRKNEEVFHSNGKKMIVDIRSHHDSAVVRFA